MLADLLAHPVGAVPHVPGAHRASTPTSGVHVLAREVVFVDIAMAQIAALGATAAFLVGYETDTWQSYAYALGRHPGGRRRPGPHAEPASGTSRRRR